MFFHDKWSVYGTLGSHHISIAFVECSFNQYGKWVAVWVIVCNVDFFAIKINPAYISVIYLKRKKQEYIFDVLLVWSKCVQPNKKIWKKKIIELFSSFIIFAHWKCFMAILVAIKSVAFRRAMINSYECVYRERLLLVSIINPHSIYNLHTFICPVLYSLLFVWASATLEQSAPSDLTYSAALPAKWNSNTLNSIY